LHWGRRKLERLVPVADLKVQGMQTRYRWPGVGAPLAADAAPLDPSQPASDFLEPWVKVPVTALLRIDEPRRQLPTGHIQATLAIEATAGPAWTSIGNQRVPLEIESTASLAYTLAESPVWAREIKGFLENVGLLETSTRLAALSPYVPGKFPVVLVHGTASSAGRWADLLNELENDPRVHDRYQFWLFSYDTGSPVAYSAWLLRQSLLQALAQLDPEGRDPALRNMVVIGHSQGGLLTKMTVVESGSALWETVSKRQLPDLVLSDKTRQILKDTLFLEPLSFVRRVIFIATPQRGSYFAGSWLAHQAARLITLPADIAHVSTDLLKLDKESLAFTVAGQRPTSVDSMTPDRPFIKALASLPIAPDVASHSIIPVKQKGPPWDDGDDGIVKYASAHIDGVESELVVASGHSCQGNPLVIEEVRRILLSGLAH
jgi:pimeloyl-ACP methyl ester carboxylesterase